MSGEKHYFADDLVGTDLSLRTHLDDEGDLWLAMLEDCEIIESVLLSKEEAARLAEVLALYATS